MNRFEVLQELIAFSKPIESLSNNLSRFDWDYEGEPLVISASQVRSVLRRFLDGKYTSEELEEWANLIECREDLEFEQEKHKAIENTIYHLANPELQGKITSDSCEKLLSAFD